MDRGEKMTIIALLLVVLGAAVGVLGAGNIHCSKSTDVHTGRLFVGSGTSRKGAVKVGFNGEDGGYLEKGHDGGDMYQLYECDPPTAHYRGSRLNLRLGQVRSMKHAGMCVTMDGLQGRKLKLERCATEHNKRLREQWFRGISEGVMEHWGWMEDEILDVCTLDDKGRVVMKVTDYEKEPDDDDKELFIGQ